MWLKCLVRILKGRLRVIGTGKWNDSFGRIPSTALDGCLVLPTLFQNVLKVGGILAFYKKHIINSH